MNKVATFVCLRQAMVTGHAKSVGFIPCNHPVKSPSFGKGPVNQKKLEAEKSFTLSKKAEKSPSSWCKHEMPFTTLTISNMLCSLTKLLPESGGSKAKHIFFQWGRPSVSLFVLLQPHKCHPALIKLSLLQHRWLTSFFFSPLCLVLCFSIDSL